MEPKEKLKYPQVARNQDDWEDGVSFVALSSADIHHGVRYRIILKNRDSATAVKATMKIVLTEDARADDTYDSNIHPQSFDEVQRVKPKVPGLKESSFIQGSNAVMRTFQVASLAPFVPKSNVIYQSLVKTGPDSKNNFMRGLEFEVTEASTQLYAQVYVYSAPEDLHLALYRSEGAGSA